MIQFSGLKRSQIDLKVIFRFGVGAPIKPKEVFGSGAAHAVFAAVLWAFCVALVHLKLAASSS